MPPQLIVPGVPAVDAIEPVPLPAKAAVNARRSMPTPLKLKRGGGVVPGVAMAVIVPERFPYAPGPNATLMPQDEPAATALPLQLSTVTRKSLGFVPPAVSVTAPLLALPSLRRAKSVPEPGPMATAVSTVPKSIDA